MIFVAGRAFCKNSGHLRVPIDVLRFYKLSGLKQVKKQGLHIQLKEYYAKSFVFRETATATAFSIIPNDYYSSNLGFFCKKEIQLEKITAIPFKFRLGSVQQCDWLEGKSVAITQ